MTLPKQTTVIQRVTDRRDVPVRPHEPPTALTTLTRASDVERRPPDVERGVATSSPSATESESQELTFRRATDREPRDDSRPAEPAAPVDRRPAPADERPAAPTHPPETLEPVEAIERSPGFDRFADRLYSEMERRLRVERERRGL